MSFIFICTRICLRMYTNLSFFVCTRICLRMYTNLSSYVHEFILIIDKIKYFQLSTQRSFTWCLPFLHKTFSFSYFLRTEFYVGLWSSMKSSFPLNIPAAMHSPLKKETHRTVLVEYSVISCTYDERKHFLPGSHIFRFWDYRVSILPYRLKKNRLQVTKIFASD